MEEAKKTTDKDINNNKNVASLSYIWILCLVPLLGKRKSKFAQFHAKQGLVLFALEIIGGLFFWFPFFGPLLLLAFILVSVLGVVKTQNGEWWKIPYLYDWSKKINF